MTFHLKNQEKIILYANDTTVPNKVSTEIVEMKHDITIAAVASWFHKNKLTINTKKNKTHDVWKRAQSNTAQNNNCSSRILTNQLF